MYEGQTFCVWTLYKPTSYHSNKGVFQNLGCLKVKKVDLKSDFSSKLQGHIGCHGNMMKANFSAI